MSSKIERAKALASSKTNIDAKRVQVSGFAELVAQLKAITVANAKTHDDIIKSIDQLSKIMLVTSEEGVDTDSIVEAINNLKKRMEEKSLTPSLVGYRVDFERDSRGLMKTGIELNPITRKLN